MCQDCFKLVNYKLVNLIEAYVLWQVTSLNQAYTAVGEWTEMNKAARDKIRENEGKYHENLVRKTIEESSLKETKQQELVIVCVGRGGG